MPERGNDEDADSKEHQFINKSLVEYQEEINANGSKEIVAYVNTEDNDKDSTSNDSKDCSNKEINDTFKKRQQRR